MEKLTPAQLTLLQKVNSLSSHHLPWGKQFQIKPSSGQSRTFNTLADKGLVAFDRPHADYSGSSNSSVFLTEKGIDELDARGLLGPSYERLMRYIHAVRGGTFDVMDKAGNVLASDVPYNFKYRTFGRIQENKIAHIRRHEEDEELLTLPKVTTLASQAIEEMVQISYELGLSKGSKGRVALSKELRDRQRLLEDLLEKAVELGEDGL